MNAEPSGDARERADRQVHTGLDALEVLERHAEVLCGLLLGPPELATNLGDPSPDVRDDSVRIFARHEDDGRPR